MANPFAAAAATTANPFAPKPGTTTANPFAPKPAGVAPAPAAANPFASAATANPFAPKPGATNPFAPGATNPFAPKTGTAAAGAGAPTMTLDPQDVTILAALRTLTDRMVGYAEEGDVAQRLRRLLEPYVKLTVEKYAFRVSNREDVATPYVYPPPPPSIFTPSPFLLRRRSRTTPATPRQPRRR